MILLLRRESNIDALDPDNVSLNELGLRRGFRVTHPYAVVTTEDGCRQREPPRKASPPLTPGPLSLPGSHPYDLPGRSTFKSLGDAQEHQGQEQVLSSVLESLILKVACGKVVLTTAAPPRVQVLKVAETVLSIRWPVRFMKPRLSFVTDARYERSR